LKVGGTRINFFIPLQILPIMNYINTPQLPATTVVNYTTVLTSAPNEIYVPPTQDPESLSNLIKNNVMIEFSISSDSPKDKNSTSVR